jgi:predicted phosphodiesterase
MNCKVSVWKQTLSACALLVLSSLFCAAQTTSPLRFHKDGTFKVVQFTDTHYQPGVSASDSAIANINEVLDAEKPDLVIFTGDVIYAPPAGTGLRRVLEPVAKRNIPFAVVFGNHDDEQDLTRPQLYDTIRTVRHNLLPERGASASPDYVLKIASSKEKGKEAARIYCMDSHSYSRLKGQVDGYDWFHASQVEWYRRQAAIQPTAADSIVVPAIAFFHIPFPEYKQAAESGSAILRGTRMEQVCSPELNSGMFTAMKEAGDVMATFAGHDHDNDFAVMWYDILLAYGRYSGGNTVYNHLKNGARVIVLKEGERAFTTWLRIRGEGVTDCYEYPADFKKGASPNEPNGAIQP